MEISRETLSAILTAIKNGTASMIEASGSPLKPLQIVPGTEVSGEVLSKQPNGRFLVRVNGEVLDMALPGETRIGVTLKMTYIGDQPRLTFAISSQTVKGSEVNISTASRWLGSIAASPTGTSAADNNQSMQRVRLFDTLPADKGAIALKLKETVRRSGLFYESHLQRWSDGSYPVEELLQEPQGRLSKLPQPTPEPPEETPANPNKLTAEVPTPATGTSKPMPAVKAEATPLNQRPAISETLPKQITPQAEAAHSSTPEEASDTALPEAAAKKSTTAPPSLLDSANRPSVSSTTVAPQGEKPFRPNLLIQPEPTGDRHLPDSPPDFLASLPGQRLDAGSNQAETSVVTAPTPQKLVQEAAGQTLKAATAQTKETKTGQEATVEEQSIARPVADDEAIKGKSSGAINSVPGKTDTDAAQTVTQPARVNRPADAGTAPQVTTSQPKDVNTVNTVPSDSKKTLDSAITDPVDPASIKQEQTFKSLPQPVDLPDTKPRPSPHPEQQPGRPLPLISPEIPKAESIMNQPRDVAAQPAKLPTQFEPPDSQTLPVIRQQLEMLNSGQFVWHGEAWQGQQMKWAIRRDDQSKKPPSARSWDTELRLELPGLGAVAAAITITGQQVRLSVSAAKASSAEIMESQRQRLVDGMESGGLTLVGMEVKHEPAP